jgi:hypothetical protein
MVSMLAFNVEDLWVETGSDEIVFAAWFSGIKE